MGEVLLATVAWLAATAIALGALVSAHDETAAIALAAAAAVTLFTRYLLRRTQSSDGPPAALVDGIEAVGIAAVGVTVAATSASVAIIAAGMAIAFAAIVQQYASLVFAHIAKRREALVGAPMGFAAALGFIAYFALGKPWQLLVAVAVWCSVECVWTSLVRALVIVQIDRALPRPPTLPPLYGNARWRRLGDGIAAARDSAFWGLVVARPIARAALQLCAEQRWITPNRITLVSTMVGFAAAAIMAAGGSAVGAIACIGVRSVLDSMDGQLSRYRACGTNFGSYIDKVSDLFVWGALFAGLAIRAYAGFPTLEMLVLPAVSAVSLALLGFTYWLARTLKPPRFEAPVAMPWAKQLWRIVTFEEPDFYLWIALAIATARYDLFVPAIAAAYAVRALALGIWRANTARSLVGKESFV